MSSAKELHEEMRERIDQEGFDYYLRSYTTPKYEGVDEVDPELAKMWHQYIALSDRIEEHIWEHADEDKDENPKKVSAGLKNRLLR